MNTWAWLYQSVQKLVLTCGSNEPNIHIKLILSQKFCMNEIRVIGTFLGSGSLDPNIWVLLPFLHPNIGTLLWWKYIKDIVIMRLAWLTQPGKFNLQLQSPSWNYEPNIRMRLDPKRWFNTKFTPQVLVLHIRFKKWFKWTHILGSNDWYNTFAVIFRFKPRCLFQTWTWTIWYNKAQMALNTMGNTCYLARRFIRVEREFMLVTSGLVCYGSLKVVSPNVVIGRDTGLFQPCPLHFIRRRVP